MFSPFMNCHGLAKVKDSEGRSMEEGGGLTLEGTGNHRFSVLIPVSTPDIRAGFPPGLGS